MCRIVKCHAECQSSMKKVLQYLNIGAIFRSTGEVSSRTDAVPGYSFREVYIHIQHRYRVNSPECQEGESLGGVEADNVNVAKAVNLALGCVQKCALHEKDGLISCSYLLQSQERDNSNNIHNWTTTSTNMNFFFYKRIMVQNHALLLIASFVRYIKRRTKC